MIPVLFAGVAKAAVVSTPIWTLDGAQDGANVGWSVATAGDVNGDGYSDVIVGEPYVDIPNFGTNGGRTRVYHGGPNGVDNGADWSAYGSSQSRLGHWVSPAGDVNGDGYDDVIVGAPYYSDGQTNEGAAWLYLGSANGLQNSPAWSRQGGQDAARLGWCVSTAGDVNGDGYDDVTIGAPFYTNNISEQGRVYIFLGGAGGLSNTPHRIIDGTGENDAMGWAVATAGDVNADGYDDVLLSAIYYEGLFTPDDCGAVYCYHGSSTGVDGTLDWADYGTQVDQFYGSSVGLAGDTNGDGYSDVLTGSGTYDNGQTAEGIVHLFAGGAGGLQETPLRSWESDQADSYLGDAVATAGDINADGFADIILGAHHYDAGQDDEGNIRVYYGSPTGPGASAVFTTDADEAGAGMGWSVGTAGDVNGDGHSDIIVGTPFLDPGGANRGRAQVHAGMADDYIASAAFFAENNQAGAGMGSCVGFADVNGDGFSDLLGSAWFYDAGQTNEGRAYCWMGGHDGITNPADWVRDGDQENAFFGRVIAGAGDVNGDGYEDVVVTASGYDDVLPNEGKAWVYHGSSGGLSPAPSWSARGQQEGGDFGWAAAAAGDVNGDGYGDVVIGKPDHTNPQPNEGACLLYLGSASGLEADPLIGWEGNQDNASAGFSVAGAGDVNGDGFDDVISGAPLQDNGQVNEGVVYLFYGAEGGLSPTPDQIREGGSEGAKFGISVASAGDVNADGFSDVVIGSSGYSNGQSQEGRVSVFLGSPRGLSTVADFTYENNDAGSYLGEWVAAAGDVNRDGYSDIAVGAQNYGANNEGRVYVFAGHAGGVSAIPIAILTGTDGRFGNHLHGGGDVDGDGWPELVVGAPDATNGAEGEGRLFLYHGNRHTTVPFGAGRARQLHMRQPDDTSPLALLGASESETEVRIRALARNAFGRSRVRAVYEVQPLGTTWSGSGQGTAWLDSGHPVSGQGSRVGLNFVAGGLSANTRHHWRMRFEGDSPYFPRTPWFSLNGNAPVEADFRTSGAPSAIAEDPGPAGAPHRLLEGIAPHPVVASAEIRFRVDQPGHLRLTLSDVSGRRVATLWNGPAGAGDHRLTWDGRGTHGRRLPAGVYFARLELGDRVERTRILIAR